jgi:hypothetical protein
MCQQHGSFLGGIGKYARVGQMLAKELVSGTVQQCWMYVVRHHCDAYQQHGSKYTGMQQSC